MKRIISIIFLLATAYAALAQGGYTQTGKASYYADKFHGRTTASGERYDKNKLTCAHLSLPFGTNLRVTNLDNSKTTYVRVNDRGPFSPNRIIDLSRKAAEEIGMISKGVANVKIEIVSNDQINADQKAIETPQVQQPNPAPTAQTAPPTSVPAPEINTQSGELFNVSVTRNSTTGYAVQIASYSGITNLFKQLSQIDLPNVTVYVVGELPNLNYKILIGPFASRYKAEQEKARVADKFPGCFIIQL